MASYAPSKSQGFSPHPFTLIPMHSRLPLLASVPGKSVAGALTAALLITGCTPPAESSAAFGAPLSAEPAVLTVSQQSPSPDSAAATSPEELSARAAASSLAARLSASYQGAQPQSASATSEHAGTVTNPQRGFTDRVLPRNEVRSFAASLAQAHHAAQEETARQEAEAAEQARQQREAEERAERERTQQERAEQQRAEAEAQTQESAAEQTRQAEPVPTAEPTSPPSFSEPTVFTGDLSAYLAQLAASYPGQISISLVEVGGQGRRASVGGDTRYTTASTYKLYLAYSILRRVEAGSLSWDEPVTGGRNVAQCFQDMIVLSDNPCPEVLGPKLGWPSIYDDARAAGATGTGPGEGNSGIKTTTDDLTALLLRLESGQLNMSGGGHDRLRNALGANIHRQGIPAGSTGQVLNKPGFISGYLHDAAIVRHPGGSYVISIMSQGSSWDALAGITRDVETALGYR